MALFLIGCGGGAATSDGSIVETADAVVETADARGETTDAVVTPSERWVMGYYAGYESLAYPVSEIDWSSLTHLAVAFYLPRTDGSLDDALSTDDGPALARALSDAGHAHGRKVVASIGGSNAHDQWVAAAAPGTLSSLVANLLGIVNEYDYDGLDLDWEPVQAGDGALIQNLVRALRAALPVGTVLTMPVNYVNVNVPDDLSLYGQLAGDLDQLNIMSYFMAGTYPGWKSWHSSALEGQASATPTSIDSSVQAYLSAGVPASKLGVGSGFFGLCYTPPVSAPGQELDGATIVADDGRMSYANIMATYHSAPVRKWDAVAHVPYLSFAGPTGPEGCGYVSYEDEQAVTDKGAYVRAHGLGGAIVWTINQGFIASAQPGHRNPLLAALGTAINSR